jgi:futalosine hydrolase
VATCSGTDAAAHAVRTRTGAMAEAMEGAAVVHAARRAGVPAIEIRSISNTTGDRAKQQWNIAAAFAALGAVGDSIAAWSAR